MPRETSSSSTRIFPAHQYRLERPNQPRSGGAQFASMRNRKFRKQLFAAGSDDELHLAAICAVA
jgi:hypothetical protein